MDFRLSQCLSCDSTQQMVVRLTLLIIVIAVIVTLIARVADDDCGCRRGHKLEELCASASVGANT